MDEKADMVVVDCNWNGGVGVQGMPLTSTRCAWWSRAFRLWWYTPCREPWQLMVDALRIKQETIGFKLESTFW